MNKKQIEEGLGILNTHIMEKERDICKLQNDLNSLKTLFNSLLDLKKETE